MISIAEEAIEQFRSLPISEKERFFGLYYAWIEEEKRKESADKENNIEPTSEN